MEKPEIEKENKNFSNSVLSKFRLVWMFERGKFHFAGNTASEEEQNGYSFSKLLKEKPEYKAVISVVRSNGDKIIYVTDQISYETYCTAHIIEKNGEPSDVTITLSPGTDFIIEKLEE